jgi:hypothetical protein
MKTTQAQLAHRAKPGRKQKHPGEPLKRRCVRATDAQWAAVQRIGVERWRELAVAEAQRVNDK